MAHQTYDWEGDHDEGEQSEGAPVSVGEQETPADLSHKARTTAIEHHPDRLRR
jgi:hypothetical protein